MTIQENRNAGKSYYHVDIGFLSEFFNREALTTDENVVTLYVPEGQKWKTAAIKMDMGNILLNDCEIKNGTIQTDSGDMFFKNCDFENLKVDNLDYGQSLFYRKRRCDAYMEHSSGYTNMGNVKVDDVLNGKMMEDEDDYNLSYTQKGKGRQAGNSDR